MSNTQLANTGKGAIVETPNPSRPTSLIVVLERLSDLLEKMIEATGKAKPASSIPIDCRLTLGLREIALLTGLSRRLIEREMAAGRFPRPDVRVGRRTLWKPDTVKTWIETGWKG